MNAATSFAIAHTGGHAIIYHIAKIGSMPLQVGDIVMDINGQSEWDSIVQEMNSKIINITVARAGHCRLLRFSEERKRGARLPKSALPLVRDDVLLNAIACNIITHAIEDEEVHPSSATESHVPQDLPRLLKAGKVHFTAETPTEERNETEIEGAPDMGALTHVLNALIPIGNAQRVHALTAELHRARMRIMAAHMAQKKREIRMLQGHINLDAKLLLRHAEDAQRDQATIDALQSRIAQLESRQIHQVPSRESRQIHITLNLDAAR